MWNIEEWPTGSTHSNHWESPNYIINVEDEKSNLRGGGDSRLNPLRTKLCKTIQPLMEEWIFGDRERRGLEQHQRELLLPDSMIHGIRIYTKGAIVAPHVDKLPLVFSAIINIAQDLDDTSEQSWPLEVYGHNGIALNITLQPGEIFMYEGHSVIHGRPFPLNGQFMAHLFVQFEPTTSGDEFQVGEPEAGSPIYMTPNSPKAKQYRKVKRKEEDTKVYGDTDAIDDTSTKKKSRQPPSLSSGTWETPLHPLAASGRVDEMYNIIEDGGDHLVHSKDTKGWTPLHEGARGGHLTVVQLLVAKGANVNERTHDGKGGTALFYAFDSHGKDSSVARFLQSHGAVLIPPDEL